ncbi:MAG: NAD(P)H-hydrate dehydratase [Planctomycetaceae bacterium]|nr:MAG: NAD(P)H-hydrate dehydratase [Planctomycetaceae bacterium]
MHAPPCPPPGLPERAARSHKGDHGRVLLVGGARGMSGAIALAAMSALRTGSGLVSAFVPSRCLETVASFEPCLMTVAAPDDAHGHFGMHAAESLALSIGRYDAIGVGPGMGLGAGSLRLVRLLADSTKVARVFDADALNLVAGTAGLTVRGPAVMTPHPGELERLTGVSPRDREAQIDAARELAGRLGVVVVLKGAGTVITDGRVQRVNGTGNAGMATGGSGDCLTGIITSLLGQGLSPLDAATVGTHLHGLAGDLAASTLGQPGLIASDLLHHLPPALLRCLSSS